jgi:hypothetical protein
MSFYINVVRDSVYKGEQVEKSDWINESGPPHGWFTYKGEGNAR